MKNINHFTPRECYFPSLTENIFKLINILRHAKYSKIGKLFSIKYFTMKQTGPKFEHLFFFFLIYLKKIFKTKRPLIPSQVLREGAGSC
jgi:hypothetical protein